MDAANAWSLVEGDENAVESAEEEKRVEKALIAAFEAENAKRKSVSVVAVASRSISNSCTPMGIEVHFFHDPKKSREI